VALATRNMCQRCFPREEDRERNKEREKEKDREKERKTWSEQEEKGRERKE
jgi:hypothetical protein